VTSTTIKEKRKELLRAARDKAIASKTSRYGAQLQPKKEWIELFPYGLVVNAEQTRPVMVFKDKNGRHVLPVWMSPVDAGVAMSQSSHQLPDAGPHKVTWKILQPLGISLKTCFFKEIRGHYQIVDLNFEGDSRIQTIEARADEVISFCLSGKAKFYATIEFMERCRVLEGELLNAVLKSPMGKTNGRNRAEYLN
jgi:uncharacterized protein